MDLTRLREHVAAADSTATFSVKVFFVEKRKIGLTAYIPNVHSDVRTEILDMYKTTLEKPLYNLEQVPYNELGSLEDTLEVAGLDIGNMDTTLSEILNPENQTQDIEGNMNIDKINYYMIEITALDEKIYLFKRFNKQKKLRSGLKGKFTGNDFRRLEVDNIIGIDPDIDLLIFQNELLIVNRLSIQFISDLRDYYIRKANEAMQDIGNYDKIINFDTFKNDCISDGRLIKRVTKIANTPSMIEDFFNKFDRLNEVIETASLSITLDDNKIIYSGAKEEREDILKCIADALFQTLLQQTIGEDKLR